MAPLTVYQIVMVGLSAISVVVAILSYVHHKKKK